MVLQFPNMRTVLMTCVLVLGQGASPVESVYYDLSHALSLAASAIKKGGSVANAMTASMSSGYGVKALIQVENWTKFPLSYATARLYGGKMDFPPTDILPGSKEAMSVHKTAHTATGTSGTVSWEVVGWKKRFVVMWSVPYDKNLHSNWLGLGMTGLGITDVAPGDRWYNQMYYGESNSTLTFQREEFDKNIKSAIYRDDDFEIVGQMGNTKAAEIKITFRPVESKKENLSKLLQPLLQHYYSSSLAEQA